MSAYCNWYSCVNVADARCPACGVWFCRAHADHGAFGAAAHGVYPAKITLPYLQHLREQAIELEHAARVAKAWAKSAGFDIQRAKTLPELLSLMQSQHCDERSYADLQASGGLAGSPS